MMKKLSRYAIEFMDGVPGTDAPPLYKLHVKTERIPDGYLPPLGVYLISATPEIDILAIKDYDGAVFVDVFVPSNLSLEDRAAAERVLLDIVYAAFTERTEK